MDPETVTVKSSSLPTHIAKLETPEGYQTWERAVKEYLINGLLWKYTTESQLVFPPRVTQADVDRVNTANAAAQVQAGANQAPFTPVPVLETLDSYETRRDRWEGKHLVCCNAILSTLGVNYYSDHKDADNAYFLWIAIRQGCKLKGSGSLNDRFRRLSLLKLSDCKNASEYAGKFKELHNEIRTIHEELRLNDAYLIFLFHTGLGKEHEDYFLHYTQTHDAINVAGKFAFTLEYATQRFIQTVTNPSASRTESTLGLVAARPEAYAATNAADQTTQRPQPGAVEGPDAVYLRRLVKFCQHCQKIYHTHHECNSKNGTQPGNSDRRRRSRSRDRNGHNSHERDNRERKGRGDRDPGRNDRNKKRKSRGGRDANPAYYDSEEVHSEDSGVDECFTAVRRDDPKCYISLAEDDCAMAAIAGDIPKR